MITAIPCCRMAAAAVGAFALFASASATAWTYDDLSPTQKDLYNRQQTFVDNVFENAGLEPPTIPLAAYLGVEDEGGDDSPSTGNSGTGDSSAGGSSGTGNSGTGESPTPGHSMPGVTVRNRGQANARDAVATYGQVFKKDAYRPSQRLRVSTAGGDAKPVQADIKTYYDDGSVQHAILSLPLDALAAGASEDLQLATQDGSANASDNDPITISRLLAAGFNAQVQIERDGHTLSQNARALLQTVVNRGGCDAVPAKTCRTWLSGPYTSEWLIGGPVDGASDNRDQQLAVYFHVRAHADESGRVDSARVDTVVENDFTYGKTASDLTYGVSIDVGNQRFHTDTLTQYDHSRWHKVLWWGRNPHLYVQPDMHYLQATQAIPNYADIEPANSYLAKLPASYPLMDNGAQTKDMGSTGAQAGIGPLPRWSSLYALGADPRAFDYMLANDDAVGAYGFHFRDAATGRPVTITNHPYITVAARRDASWSPDIRKDLYTACESHCDSPYHFELAHHPSIGFLPYLVTGDYYYLEELQFAGSYAELWTNPGYRDDAKGILRGAADQVRQQAWSLRTLAQAAYATPAHDPMKSYFTGLLQNIASDYKTYYLQQPEKHPLHILDNYTNYKVNGRDWVGIAPWQEDFFAWATSYATNLGFSEFEPFSKWLLQFQVGRMTNWLGNPKNGFCWLEASTYKLQIRPSRGADFYDSLDQAYQATLPRLAGLACNSQSYRNQMGDHTQSGEMAGYPDSATGFPSNLQPALAASVDRAVGKSHKAWQLFDQRSVRPDYRNYPNWAIVPRR